MSDSNSTTTSGGIGLSGFLGLLFIGLKLGGVIHWSWWWVLAPFWLPFAVVLAMGLFVMVVALICAFGGGELRVTRRNKKR